MNTTTQCLWLQGILGEFGIEFDTSIVIYCDNQSTIRISTDPVPRKRTNHIDIHMHYITGLVHDGVIAILYCASSEQVADIFTKVFSDRTFSNLKYLLGIDDHVVNIYLIGYFIHFFSCPFLREYLPTCGFASFPCFVRTSSM